MTIHYEVDGKVIKHFKTAVRVAVKTNATLLTRNEKRKNYKRGTVLIRSGVLYSKYLTKVRKQWAGMLVKEVNTSLLNFHPSSKYQRKVFLKKRAKKFNKLSYNSQQLRLEAEWHRLVYKIGYYDNIDLTLSDVQKKMENTGCVFKTR